MSYMMQPQIILLKEGTDTSQGTPQLISNINACTAIAEIVKTTLGPRGMDKLIHQGGAVTISNDGATIVKLLDIVHPAAKTLVDIAKSQDAEVGDGTTTVVLLACEFLENVKALAEEGMHAQIIIQGFRLALQRALKHLDELSINVADGDEKAHHELLTHCASTALTSKLIANQKDFFADLVVRAVVHLDQDQDLNMIGIKQVTGGSVMDSFLTEGVAFKKTFAYAGFEQQPKKFDDPKILLLHCDLELQNESAKAEIRIEDPSQYQSIVDAEWRIIYRKLEAIVATGAKIVLSRKVIGDLATQYFADRNIFCAGRVEEGDMERTARATGAEVQTSLNDLNEKILGTCGHFEERQIGAERFNLFMGCPDAQTVTIVLRGGAKQFIEETERSIHDAICIVRRAVKHKKVVGGAGAIEMELSKDLRAFSRTIQNKVQLVVSAFAKSLEKIPRQLSANAGFDSTDIINELRARHAKGDRWAGVDIENEGVCDAVKNFIWEPSLLKANALAAAAEAACMVLSVDETVRNPKSQAPRDDRPVPRPRR